MPFTIEEFHDLIRMLDERPDGCDSGRLEDGQDVRPAFCQRENRLATVRTGP